MACDQTLIVFGIIALLVIIAVYGSQRCSFSCEIGDSPFSVEDQQAAKQALDELKKQGEEVVDITTEELEKIADDILIAKIPTNDSVEEYSSFSSRFWPYHYYSYPYHKNLGGTWPPGLYSRLYHWSPGFYSGSGWSYYLRPGMANWKWPRNRWVRHNRVGGDNYYYVSNRDDYRF